jgi:hypothetical protein
VVAEIRERLAVRKKTSQTFVEKDLTLSASAE